VKGIRYRTQKEGVDESTALRQLLRYGLQEYAIKLYRRGQVSLREAADLGMAIHILQLMWKSACQEWQEVL